MATVFQTARGKAIRQPGIVAATLLSAMAGVSRAMLENDHPRDAKASSERELKVMVRAYLNASRESLQRTR